MIQIDYTFGRTQVYELSDDDIESVGSAILSTLREFERLPKTINIKRIDRDDEEDNDEEINPFGYVF